MKDEEEVGHYVPDEDEPSIFGGVGGQPNEEWVYWYRFKYKDSGNPFVRAKEVLKMLEEEEPRTPGNYWSKFESKKGKILPLREVIHHRYTHNVSFTEAHNFLIKDYQ